MLLFVVQVALYVSALNELYATSLVYMLLWAFFRDLSLCRDGFCAYSKV